MALWYVLTRFGLKWVWAVVTPLLLWPLSASAQDSDIPATLGNHTFAYGLTNDPFWLPVEAGGGEEMFNIADARILDASSGVPCGTAFITDAPTVEIHLDTAPNENESAFLRVYVDVPTESITDPYLLILGPDGQYRCNDDARLPRYSGIMPVIDFVDPLEGRYLIWVGNYQQDPSAIAQLFVTALRANLPSTDGY